MQCSATLHCEAEMKQESDVLNTLSRLRVCVVKVVKVAAYDTVVTVAVFDNTGRSTMLIEGRSRKFVVCN